MRLSAAELLYVAAVACAFVLGGPLQIVLGMVLLAALVARRAIRTAGRAPGRTARHTGAALQ